MYKKLKVYKFTTSHCGACKMVEVSWVKARSEAPANVTFESHILNQDKESEKFITQYKINAVPTLIIVDEATGDVLWEHHGFISKVDLLAAIEKINNND